ALASDLRSNLAIYFLDSGRLFAADGPSTSSYAANALLPMSVYRLLGRLHASPRPRRALPRQTQHPENRAQASDLTDAHETLGPQDHLLFKNDPDARRRPWLVCQSLCLWTGSVNMVISTFETLPARHTCPPSIMGLCTARVTIAGHARLSNGSPVVYG